MEGEKPNLMRRALTVVSCYLLLLLVCGIDYTTGNEMHLGTFYLIAVATASWNLRPREVVVFALVAALLWSGAEYLSGVHFSRMWLVYWNAANHLGVVTIIATLISKTKATIDRQHGLIRNLGQTLLKASQFKELVPVCRVCHQVHLQANYRDRIDGLLREGTDLETVGHVCPTCLDERAARVASIPVEKYFQTDAA